MGVSKRGLGRKLRAMEPGDHQEETTARITVSVAAADGEAAAGRLMEEEIPFEVCDGTTLVRAPEGRVLLSLFVVREEAASWRERVTQLLAEEGIAGEWSEAAVSEDWRDAWKAHFRPRPVGPFVLVPSWETYTPGPGETILELDPGRAFGTGGHASTRLCLRALGRLERCERFLDVGCGSGVLAIACARRWPEARGVGIDIDPEALEVSRENAQRNGVEGRIEWPSLQLEAVEGTFDVVLANLMSELLRELAGALAARVRPGGRLIASGLLAEEAPRVVEALEAVGLTLSATEDEEDWRALVLERRG
ncbi:MAG TPA: 50S ribosomal protein L11 methyltransferase [Polyangia bacterium]|nr:50S ribosomal protein L11 methyltransferase [Polyangia bacterium]